MIDPNKVILDSEQSDAIISAQAAEIRRLRLTDEEREAVANASQMMDIPRASSGTEPLWFNWRRRDAEILRELLERLG